MLLDFSDQTCTDQATPHRLVLARVSETFIYYIIILFVGVSGCGDLLSGAVTEIRRPSLHVWRQVSDCQIQQEM